jgi:hypothetical protein
MSNSILPSDFQDLEPYADWALSTETLRNAKRTHSSQDQLKTFANAILPRVDAIATHVDSYAETSLPESSERLFLMLLSLAEVAPAIEYYGQPTVVDGYDNIRFKADESHVLRPKR